MPANSIRSAVVLWLLVIQAPFVVGADASGLAAPCLLSPETALRRVGIDYSWRTDRAVLELLAESDVGLEDSVSRYTASLGHLGDVKITSLKLVNDRTQFIQGIDPAATVIMLESYRHELPGLRILLRATAPGSIDILKFPITHYSNSLCSGGKTPTMSLAMCFLGQHWSTKDSDELADENPDVIADWTANGPKYLAAEHELDRLLQPPAASLIRAWVRPGESILYPRISLVFETPSAPDEVLRYFRHVLPRVGVLQSRRAPSGTEARLVVRQFYPYPASVVIRRTPGGLAARSGTAMDRQAQTEIRWTLARAVDDPVVRSARLER